MAYRLAWTEAHEAGSSMLGDFVCSPLPPKLGDSRRRLKAGRWWERDVQSTVRGLESDLPDDETLLLGRDRQGIGAVVWFCQIEPGEWKLLAAAVASRLRRSPDRYLYGDEAADVALAYIERLERAEGRETSLVWGVIHNANAPSQALAERQGFTYTGEFDREHGRWDLLLDLTDVEA